MKTKAIFMLALTLVLVLAASAPMVSAADEVGVPFKAYYPVDAEIQGMVNYCLIQVFRGEGEATHLGKSTWYSEAHSCFDGTQSGWILFTAANGDQLSMDFAGTHAGYPGPVEFGGDYTITGGTGRFEGATGTGDYWGTAFGGAGQIYFEGMLYK